jgi:histidinol-phosphatase
VTSRSDDLALALELADIADAITLERFRAEDLAVETKPDMTPVTEADRAVEEAIRSRLARDRPGDAIVGEEFGDSDTGAGGRRWIIDPIDGTKGYLRGMPVWATLLALQEDDLITVGTVSAPALHRRWWAARGLGAFVTDGLSTEPRRLSVSAVSSLEDAQVSLAGLEDWEGTGRLDALLELSRRCWRTRGFGDMWSYMLVAEGVADIGGLDPDVKLWDLAAPLVIVEEAGGRFTDLDGRARADGGSGIASNGPLHDVVLKLLGGSADPAA